VQSHRSSHGVFQKFDADNIPGNGANPRGGDFDVDGEGQDFWRFKWVNFSLAVLRGHASYQVAGQPDSCHVFLLSLG
jgi:hypothetical protein